MFSCGDTSKAEERLKNLEKENRQLQDSLKAAAQNDSKSFKIQKISLEVMKKDLGEMTWKESKEVCAALGDGWRLPTIKELEVIYQFRNKIGLNHYQYWSSTESSNGALSYWFPNGGSAANLNKSHAFYVCAVRTLK